MPARAHYRALVALAQSYPLAAAAAFVHQPSTTAASTALNDAFEAEARVLARGHSLATIAAIRDHAWGPGRALVEHLFSLARAHLRWEGNHVRLAPARLDQGGRHERIMRWRWLALRLPQDLLLAALAAAEGVEPCSDRVRLVEDDLAPTLSEPVAETHLHMGAALDFGDLWIALLERLTHPQAVHAGFGGGPAPFEDKDRYTRTLLAAALARQLLVIYLYHHDKRPQHTHSFSRFLREYLPEVTRDVGGSASTRKVLRSCQAALAILGVGLSLHDRGDDVSTARLSRSLHLLWGPGHRRTQQGLDELIAGDPVARWLRPGPGRARPETQLIARGLEHVRRCPPDGAFARTFWQLQRVRNRVFAHLVQNPGTAGLGWFVRHYGRLTKHRGCLRSQTTETALRLQSKDLNLRSLELRTAPPETRAMLRDDLRAIAEQATAFSVPTTRPRPELGLVLHFIKSAEPGPGRYSLPCRHGRWFQKQWRLAGAIAQDLRSNPAHLLLLRGLDVANDELARPTWVLTPLFQRARAASRHAAAVLAREHPAWGVSRLKTTLHLGEEFHRLSGGLRRIHEALECGLLEVGDRIGHGLALGWSAEAWVEANPLSLQPRDERFFDLLWELERYERGELTPAPGRESYLSARIRERGRELFGRLVPASALLEFRRQLLDPEILRGRLNYPYGRGVPGLDAASDDPLVLCARYLLDPALHERARELIEVGADQAERAMLEAAQHFTCTQLANMGVTVEANPSSNLLIGDFGDLREHPTFALAPVPLRTEDTTHARRLPVSLNSDDPLTFASSLGDEYAYMYSALVGQGVSAQSARDWIGDARRAGWDSRFTLPASADVDNLAWMRRRC